MRGVSIIGVGLTKFGEHWETSFRQLIAEAGIKALVDSGLDGKDIQAVYGGCMASGRLIGQEHIGALIADQLGLTPIASTRVEAACASGSVALRSAFMAIASGLYDVVAVGGAEKMTEVSGDAVSTALGGAGDQETELFFGATFPALYALMARAHMHKFGTTEEQMAMCSVKNHYNGTLNPYAQFQNEITVEQVMKSGYVASPMKLLDCSPISDGAAALILCSNEKAKELKKENAVEIIGSGQASDTLGLSGRKNLYETIASKEAAKQAYEMAGVNAKDVDFAEVHDCFSIAELMAIEALGFVEQGKSGKFVEDGETKIDGSIPINTSGGLKCGHPVGATGVKQVIEAVEQLQGRCGKRQLKDVEIGLTHNVGGSGATAVVHVLRRLQ